MKCSKNLEKLVFINFEMVSVFMVLQILNNRITFFRTNLNAKKEIFLIVKPKSDGLIYIAATKIPKSSFSIWGTLNKSYNCVFASHRLNSLKLESVLF